MTDERSVEFFELVGDSSSFQGAFNAAKAQAGEFAAAFKASSVSVAADADRMGLSIQRAIATGQLSRGQANAMIGSRLQFFGAPGGSDAAGTGGVKEAGMNLSGLATGAFAALGVVSLLAGAGAALSQMVSTYASFSAQVLRSSEAIGMNAQELQTWLKISDQVGIGQQSMTMDFERFAKNLADGATALKTTGVTLQDLGITTTDVGTAVLQLADYFHTHNDQAQKAAIASALFGRSGAELIPVLDQGSQAFRNYQAELQKMGVLLSNSQLFAGAQAQVALQQFGMAFDSAKDRFLGAVLPGFTTFFQQLTVIIENNMPLWQQLGQVVGQVVMFIAGIVAGLTGSTIDLTKSTTDASSAYQGLGGAAQDAAAGQTGLAGSTKSATDAITDQINALQDQKRAYDDNAEAQKAALQSQLDTLHDVTDSRRRQGEDIVSYERRLAELNLSDKIRSIDAAKTVYDRNVDDHVAALQREQQAVKEASGAMGADLSAGIGAGMNAGVQASAQAITKVEQQWADAGTKYGAWLVTWFKNPSEAIKQAADTFGQLLGSAIVTGAEKQIGSGLTSWLVPHQGASRPAPKFAASGAITNGPMIAGEAGPEVILPMNDRSRSLSLMEQSGMASLARSASGAGNSAAGGTVFNVTFTGPVADELVANRVIAAIEKQARSQGLRLSTGWG